MLIDVAEWTRVLYEGNARDVVLHSGRGCGKDTEVATYVIHRARSEPGFRAVFLRQFQASIRDSIKALVVRRIRQLGVAGEFRVRDTYIECPATGGYIWFAGFDRNPENLKGLEDVDIAVVNETQTLRREADMLFHPSVRKDDSRIIYVGNPRYETDYFSDLIRGEARSGAEVVKVRRQDNLWFPAVLEGDRLADMGKANYRHIWEGDFITLTGQVFDASKVPAAPLWADADRCVRAWDTAATADGGDYTVGLLLARRDADFQIQDVVRGQWSADEVQGRVVATAAADGDGVAIVMETGGGDAGKQVERLWRRLLVGYHLDCVNPTGSKATRAMPAAGAINGGLVCRLAGAGWWSALAGELAAFSENPADMRDIHDDQVDALAYAFNRLARRVHRPMYVA